ncbi:MAG: toll/interleukin-1 receptor domain-containing protein [Candidatus Thiodiazotropha endolucinida]|uniref:TIR domain-containing protein n=1 Tax=Candidatus Thiodiazotropha endolucinida TaxID=1655433 RepID=A0A7Z0VJ49_9GAMM|nr:toll/interleukin-1 receptor domain-containing protein [Candidatus Thiodiazotropha endolucinida]ODJ86146.1 hypothetical protein CODIS_36820 [Candidatus Thiodiazotropha endolucinida]
MSDVFISYSTKDEKIAQFMHKHLIAENVKTFLASVSIEPGKEWSSEILNNLKTSSWVFFLASKSACESPFVQQELGGALLTDKKIVPIVWDMPPSNLPGWISKYQALNLSGITIDQAKERISQIASKIKSDKFVGGLVVVAMIGGLIWAYRK